MGRNYNAAELLRYRQETAARRFAIEARNARRLEEARRFSGEGPTGWGVLGDPKDEHLAEAFEVTVEPFTPPGRAA
jgi:hypothetical protein